MKKGKLQKTQAVDLYFKHLNDSRPLSRQQERELANRIQKGDLEARNELVRANLRFVVQQALPFQRCGTPLPDLISAGNLGLLTAAERFDPDRGCKFISYAVWWVRQSIIQSLNEHGRTIRLPANKILLLQNVYSRTRQLRQLHGAEYTSEYLDTLALESGLSATEIGELIEQDQFSSLDSAKGETTTLLECLPDLNQEAPDGSLIRAEIQEQLEAILATLDGREQMVIRLFFGLNGKEPMSLAQIGGLLNISRERVRQIKEDVLAKMRHPKRKKTIKDLWLEI